MIQNLPDDIVFEITRHLTGKELLNLELTSVFFHSLFVDLWKRLCEDYLIPESVAKIHDICSRITENITNTQRNTHWKYFGFLCANFFQLNKQWKKCYLCNWSMELQAVPLREVTEDVYECRIFHQCKRCSIKTKDKISNTHFGCSSCFASVAEEDLKPSEKSSQDSNSNLELCECGSVLRKWCCLGFAPACECTSRCVHCEEPGLVQECQHCALAYICPKCSYACDRQDCVQYQSRLCNKCFQNHGEERIVCKARKRRKRQT